MYCLNETMGNCVATANKPVTLRESPDTEPHCAKQTIASLGLGVYVTEVCGW